MFTASVGPPVNRMARARAELGGWPGLICICLRPLSKALSFQNCSGVRGTGAASAGAGTGMPSAVSGAAGAGAGKAVGLTGLRPWRVGCASRSRSVQVVFASGTDRSFESVFTSFTVYIPDATALAPAVGL